MIWARDRTSRRRRERCVRTSLAGQPTSAPLSGLSRPARLCTYIVWALDCGQTGTSSPDAQNQNEFRCQTLSVYIPMQDAYMQHAQLASTVATRARVVTRLKLLYRIQLAVVVARACRHGEPSGSRNARTAIYICTDSLQLQGAPPFASTPADWL